jgi:hypothetical protein
MSNAGGMSASRAEKYATATRVRTAVTTWAVACSVYFLFVAAAGAIELIAEQEAALPDDLTGSRRGGPTRGPDIVLVSPAPNAGLVKSPLTLKIRFRPHGGAKIDRDSILITYKKIPSIDMTQRLTQFIRADGIEVQNAEVPPGAHRIRIDVKDGDGRATTDYLIITVAK